LTRANLASHDYGPRIEITSDTEGQRLIDEVSAEFNLNEGQRRAFRCVALQSLGRGRVGDQLRLAIIGEGGTGKSRVIDALRSWFSKLGRSDELVVTAMTGAAASNINGSTLHSAAGIRPKAKIAITTPTLNLVQDWSKRKFVRIDILWKKPQRHYKEYHLVARGYKLWRSQNAVVVLDEQMRQTDDYVLQDLLRALRYRKVEERHLKLLRSRIAKNPDEIEACGVLIVRRNKLRHSLNDWMLHRNADRQNVKVLYSIAHISDANGMSERDILAQRANSQTPGDSVLALIPDAPLVITENLDVEGGNNELHYGS
jgi:AAA domain